MVGTLRLQLANDLDLVRHVSFGVVVDKGRDMRRRHLAGTIGRRRHHNLGVDRVGQPLGLHVLTRGVGLALRVPVHNLMRDALICVTERAAGPLPANGRSKRPCHYLQHMFGHLARQEYLQPTEYRCAFAGCICIIVFIVGVIFPAHLCVQVSLHATLGTGISTRGRRVPLDRVELLLQRLHSFALRRIGHLLPLAFACRTGMLGWRAARNGGARLLLDSEGRDADVRGVRCLVNLWRVLQAHGSVQLVVDKVQLRLVELEKGHHDAVVDV